MTAGVVRPQEIVRSRSLRRATLVAFHVDRYSSYSARLPAFADDSAPAAAPDSRTDHRPDGH